MSLDVVEGYFNFPNTFERSKVCVYFKLKPANIKLFYSSSAFLFSNNLFFSIFWVYYAKPIFYWLSLH